MFRLLGSVVGFALLLALIGFNLDHKSDISFGFAQLTDVPVFLTIIASFSAGLLAAVPMLLIRKKKKTEKTTAVRRLKNRDQHHEDTELPVAASLPVPKDAKKTSKSKKKTVENGPEADAGSYGVD